MLIRTSGAMHRASCIRDLHTNFQVGTSRTLATPSLNCEERNVVTPSLDIQMEWFTIEVCDQNVQLESISQLIAACCMLGIRNPWYSIYKAAEG